MPMLTNCGIVMPYDNLELGHQAITWTNVDLSSVRSSDKLSEDIFTRNISANNH